MQGGVHEGLIPKDSGGLEEQIGITSTIGPSATAVQGGVLGELVLEDLRGLKELYGISIPQGSGQWRGQQ